VTLHEKTLLLSTIRWNHNLFKLSKAYTKNEKHDDQRFFIVSWKEVNRGRSCFFGISVFLWKWHLFVMLIYLVSIKILHSLYGSAITRCQSRRRSHPSPISTTFGLCIRQKIRNQIFPFILPPMFILLFSNYFFSIHFIFWELAQWEFIPIFHLENSYHGEFTPLFRRSRQPLLVINPVLDFRSKISQFKFNCQKRIFNYI